MNEIQVLKAFEAQQIHHPWEWPVPIYLFLGGVTAGILVLCGLHVLRQPEGGRSNGWRFFPLLASLLLSLGMGALFLDLSHKLYVARFYLSFEIASPMSWGSWILMLVYPSAILLWLSEPPDNVPARFGALPLGRHFLSLVAWASTPSKRRVFGMMNIATGVALGIYTGILLSASEARPLWGSAILGPLFLSSGLSTGAALMLLFRIHDSERHFLSRLDLAFVGTEILFLSLFLIGLVTSGDTPARAASLLLGGPYTPAFWGLVVAAGLVVPLLAGLMELLGRARHAALVPVLVLVGGFSLRWILVFAGQTSHWGIS